MALKKDFYNEIFEQEQRWIEFINLNLLNSIYCNLELKPYYIKKKKELEFEYKLTNNVIIGQIITLIDNIIIQIDLLKQQYDKMIDTDFNSLIPLFLMNQMNNVYQQKETIISNKDKFKIKKQILENQLYTSNKGLDDDSYLYYDFPEEKKIK